MFDHQHILERIEDIEIFLKSIGLIKKFNFPEDWDLDSTIKYVPKDFNFKVLHNNNTRILISIDINIVSGLIFTFSGEYKSGRAVYEEIHTDYYFKQKNNDQAFFIEEWRDYKLNRLFENEIN